jgi:hypothetical protein
MEVEILTLYIDLAIAFLVMVMAVCGVVACIIFIYALFKWRIW